MNRRNNRFLSDKLRYTKRTTTKREFNFIPIPHGQEAGDRAGNEQNFSISPPKWASTPRTKATPKDQKKFHMDISLIEPRSGAILVPRAGAEEGDPTINLAALRAAELTIQKQSSEPKESPEEGPAPTSRPKLARDPIKKASNDKGSEEAIQNSPNVESEEKDLKAPKGRDAGSNSESTAKSKSGMSKSSTKVQASSNNESEGPGKKSRNSSRGRRSSVPSKDSKPFSWSSPSEEPEDEVQTTSKVGSSSAKVSSSKSSGPKSKRSGSGSRSSRAEDSENEVPKISKVGSSPAEDPENEVTTKSSKVVSSKSSGRSKSKRSGSGSRSSQAEEPSDEVQKTSKVGSSKNSSRSKSQQSRSGSRSSQAEEPSDEVQKTSKVGSSKNSGSKSQRSRSGSLSSVVEDSEDEVPKTSKVGSSKNSGRPKSQRSRTGSPPALAEGPEHEVVEDSENEVPKSSKGSGGSASEGFSVSRRRSKSRDEVETVSDEKVLSRGRSTRKSSESKKSGVESQNSPDEDRPSKGKRVRGKSSGSDKKTTDEDRSMKRRSTEILMKFEKLVAASVPFGKQTRKSSGSGKSSRKSSGNDMPDVKKKSGSSEKSTKIGKKPITRSSSSEELTSGKKPTRRSVISEKSGRGRASVGKRITRSSSSEELTTEKKPTRRSVSSEKSGRGRSSVGKRITRSSSSEELTTEKKPTRRSVSSEKSGRAIAKKRTRSSSSEEVTEAASFRSRKSSRLERSGKKRSSTSRSISRPVDVPEMSPGEGTSTRYKNVLPPTSDLSSEEEPSVSQKVFGIFKGKGQNNRSKIAAPKPVQVDSSSDPDKLFSPQAPKGSKSSGSKKGAKFKKGVKAKPRKGAPRASGIGASDDERLFSPKKRKVPDRQIPSSDGEKSEIKLKKSSKKIKIKKSDKKKLQKTINDASQDAMSEEISLQDKPLITTFGGMPLSGSERYSVDENSEDVEKERMEKNIHSLEDILETNKNRLDRSFDTSRGLKVGLLNPLNTSSRKRPVQSITDLDVLWSFLSKSFKMILKSTADVEKKRSLKKMISFLEEHFMNEMSEQLKKKEMHAALKDKSEEIDHLTHRLLYLKQRNRQLEQKIYEKEQDQSLEKEEDTVLEKFQNFCLSFVQIKRNFTSP